MASDVKQATENDQVEHVLRLIDRLIAEGNKLPDNQVERYLTKNDDWKSPVLVNVMVENKHANHPDKFRELVFRFNDGYVTEYNKKYFTAFMDNEFVEILRKDLKIVFA